MFYIINPINRLCTGETIEISEKILDELIAATPENAAILSLVISGKTSLSEFRVYSGYSNETIIAALEYWINKGIVFSIEASETENLSGYILKNEIYKVVELAINKPLNNNQIKKIDDALKVSSKRPSALIVDIIKLKNPTFLDIIEAIK